VSASRIHVLLAALMGAAGVALWAMAAHRAGGESLVTSAQFLLIHACAVLGLTACRKQALVHDRIASIASAVLILGTLLFSGDIVARVLVGDRLFPIAAPVGGSLLILGWLMVGVSAVWQKSGTAD
jgi:uncharacterized membrane protein YgdD (TMEM256/DUF423 family)